MEFLFPLHAHIPKGQFYYLTLLINSNSNSSFYNIVSSLKNYLSGLYKEIKEKENEFFYTRFLSRKNFSVSVEEVSTDLNGNYVRFDRDHDKCRPLSRFLQWNQLLHPGYHKKSKNNFDYFT